jgi:DNA polymerase-3 subunit epsilon
MLQHDLVFLDLETTGATAGSDRITEIGLIHVRNGEQVDEWSTLLNPTILIPQNIQNLTGISNEMVKNAPTFEEIANKLYKMLKDKVLVAHNVRFDFSFLKNEFRHLGVDYNPKMLCTVRLSRALFPEEKKHGLDSIIKRAGISIDARHRALADARAIWEFAQFIYRHLEPEVIQSAAEKLMRSSSLPKGISEDTIQGIPRGPGVYIFRDEQNTVLYVGKSKSLRARVLSHFSGDHSNKKDQKINQSISTVDWITTAGELGALITESRLVKTLKPIYNRRLRQQENNFTIHWDPIEGPDIPIIEDMEKFEKIPFGKIYGAFPSRRVALKYLRDQARDFSLCLLKIGLEKGKGPCFAHQLGNCRGACVEKETLISHSMRLSAALSKQKIPQWPYSGSIKITEHNERSDFEDVHIIDQWIYIEYETSGKNNTVLSENTNWRQFDSDTFHIIRKTLEVSSPNITIATIE